MQWWSDRKESALLSPKSFRDICPTGVLIHPECGEYIYRETGKCKLFRSNC